MGTSLYDTAWAGRSYDMKRLGPYSRHERRLILGIVKALEFSSVLDAGCGQGDLLVEIANRYLEIERFGGIDLLQTGVDVTQQRLNKTGRFEALDLQIKHLDEKFDLVTCVDVLEHVEDDLSAIRNLHEMTRKYLVLASVQGKSLPAWEAKVVGHVRNYQRGELVAKMQQCGFTIINVIEWGFPFYSPLYRWLLTIMRGQGTHGTYTWKRKLIAQIIYSMFRLNSSRRGDLIIVVGKVTGD